MRITLFRDSKKFRDSKPFLGGTTVSFAVDPKENVASTYKQYKAPSRGAWPDLPWDPYKMCQAVSNQKKLHPSFQVSKCSN